MVETGFKPVSTKLTNNKMDKHKFQGKYRIESTRLKDYDYSRNGAYFVTICTKNSMHLFGSIVDQKLIPNRQAEVVTECWLGLPAHYTNCVLDKFIIMPNHVHGIIIIDNEIAETGLKPNENNVEMGRGQRKCHRMVL